MTLAKARQVNPLGHNGQLVVTLANITGDDGQAQADVTPGSDHFVAMTLARVASPMAVKRSPCHRFGPSPVGSENCSRKAS